MDLNEEISRGRALSDHVADVEQHRPNRIPRLLIQTTIILVVSVLFLTLSPFEIGGGDHDEILRMAGSDFAIFHYRAPLAVATHQIIYHLGKRFGVTPTLAVRVTSAVAGGFFVLLLFNFSRDPRLWVPCLASGTLMVFWGHVETYAPAYAAALWFLMLGIRYARRERLSAWPLCGAWLLASGCHMSNSFYLPALAFLIHRLDRRGTKALIGAVLVLALVFSTVPFFTFPLGYDTLAPERLTPLLRMTGAYHHFTLFSWAHLKLVLKFWGFASPLGLIGIVGGLLLLRRDPAWQFLMAASGCALLWTFLWNPDLGWADWDLFGQCAVPLNLMAGWTLLQGKAFSATQAATEPSGSSSRE